ncbi:MAG: hypothetical protein LBB53_02605 [Prevotellaceae bacterium]|jgi:hypothetical protein|nr:hypothetical protein [Prevotellaceae bacterium]
MIKLILDYLFESSVVMANPAILVALIPALISAGTAIAGGVKEGKARKEMKAEQAKWQAENDAWYNKNYYGDYLQRADVQNVLKNMREQLKEQNEADNNKKAVLGLTDNAAAAAKESRNKLMSQVYSNAAAQGQRWKDNIDAQYRNRKYGVQGMEYDVMGQQAQSANNLMYNGVKGLAGTDWATIFKNQQNGTYSTIDPGVNNTGYNINGITRLN